jgi:antitoxin (DNA-binding transcriptional repressor) of toxin-antitoxin stability system
MSTVDIDGEARLCALVEKALEGEPIVLTKGGKPVAEITPIPSRNFDRQPGRLKGLITVHDNFDDPLPPDIAAGFGIDS